MGRWYEQIADEIAVLSEHVADAEPIVWARALRRDHGRDGAATVVLASSAPPRARRLALEELAR